MASQPFDHLARRLRRRLRRVPALQPLVNRAGLWLWRRDLRRRAVHGEASEHAARPIRLDPRSIETQIPASDLPLAGVSLRDAVGRVDGGSWDAQPRPLRPLPFFFILVWAWALRRSRLLRREWQRLRRCRSRAA